MTSTPDAANLSWLPDWVADWDGFIDLGDFHAAHPFAIVGGETVGWTIWHLRPGVTVAEGQRAVWHNECHAGSVWITGEGHPTWTVESMDPLTLSPSVLCSCGDHGFIREGRWIRA